MAYPTVLTQAELGPHVRDAWINLNNFILQARSLGLQIWMPEEIKFDAILVDQFQALAVQTLEGGTSTEAQTGTDSSTQTGTDTTTTAATTTDTTTQITTHGESVNTTDLGQTLYVPGDSTTAPGAGYIQPPISLPF